MLFRDPIATIPADVEQLLQQRDVVLSTFKINLARAQNRMKQIVDRKRANVEFQLGDMVYVKLQPYRQVTLREHHHQKLGLCYFGPFPVIERIGTVMYHLLLPPSARIHSVFHVSILKKCIGTGHQQYYPLPLAAIVNAFVPVPMAILDSRRIQQQGSWVDQVHVQWSHLDASDSTWESVAQLKFQFPQFDLEEP